MEILYYLVEWNKIKSRTWSGTCLGLYNALKSHFQVVDIDLNPTYFNKFVAKVKRKVLGTNDMGLRNIRLSRNKIKNLFPKSSTKNFVLQFSEIAYNSPNQDTYIYIDEDANHVKYLYEKNRTDFAFSNFKNTSYSTLCKRSQSQEDYFNTCSGIFTMGKWLKNSIVERLGIPEEKVYHVGGGINLDISRIKSEPKFHNKILFVGRDFERKGGYLLLDAFKILKSERRDIELHIAGPTSNPNIEGINGVYYYGDASHDLISDLMNKCDLFCMPSYYEAYGLVFIEALVYGLPCIGRNAYEMPYFIEDGVTGLLLNNDDPNELADKISIVLSNISYTDAVISRRSKYLLEYSWDTVACRIAKIITKNRS